MPKLIVDDHGRQCSGCEEYKTWEHFSKHKQSSTGRKARCRECCKKCQAGSTELREVERKINPMMKAFLVDRIHLKREQAA